MKKLLLLLSGVLFLLPVCGQQDDHQFDVAKNLDVLNAIYKQLDLLYVDTIHADEVIPTGINAMLHSLDPYTVYYPEEKQKDLNYMITGTYAGIGAIIRYNLSIGRVIREAVGIQKLHDLLDHRLRVTAFRELLPDLVPGLVGILHIVEDPLFGPGDQDFLEDRPVFLFIQFCFVFEASAFTFIQKKGHLAVIEGDLVSFIVKCLYACDAVCH